jgi:hypothetical protein
MRSLACLKLLVAGLGLLTVINPVATSAEPGMLFVVGAVERPLNLQISDLEEMPTCPLK